MKASIGMLILASGIGLLVFNDNYIIRLLAIPLAIWGGLIIRSGLFGDNE